MMKCYHCGRNEQEVKQTIIDIYNEEMEKIIDDKNKRKEDELLQIKNTIKEWEELGIKAPQSVLEIFNMNLLDILKNISTLENKDIRNYLLKAKSILGNIASNIKLTDIEKNVKEKLQNMLNEIENADEIDKYQKMYKEKIDKIFNKDDIIKITQLGSDMNHGEYSYLYNLKFGICDICYSRIQSMIPKPY